MALLRHHRLLALACVLCWPLAGATAQEKVAWLSDRAEVAIQARKDGKLLLVVHLSGDFAKNAADSAEAKTYRAAALADPRVRKELSSRFVVLYQQAGEAEVLRKLLAAKTQPVRTDFALTYVCLPDLRVIHFISGFVSADQLLGELAWAEKSYATIAGLPSADEPLVARKAHQAAIAKSDWALFERSFKTRWTAESLANGPSTVELPAVLTAAHGAVELSLAQRMGKSWQRLGAQNALPPLLAHGELGRDLAHLVLSEFPLVSLGDLERPAFEVCTGHRFWQASRRREALASWWKTETAGSKPLLLVVADDGLSQSASDASGHVWPPAKPETLPLLAQFAVQTVSLDELAAVASDAGLDPLTYRATNPPRFVTLAAGGKSPVLLGKAASLTRLAQVMSAAKSGTGALAATTAGEPSDEEK